MTCVPPLLTDDELFQRGAETLLASWDAYARASASAAVQRLAGVAAAVFPAEPERGVYNNALLERGLLAGERRDALDAMEGAYADAGVTRFAAWVHEDDDALRAEVERRGYTLDTSTRAMGMALDDLVPPRPDIDVAPLAWVDYVRIFDLPTGLLQHADHVAFHLIVASVDGQAASTAVAFDHDGDCGIYNVGTLSNHRRRGLGTAVTAYQLYAARDRGCRTASLQSTEMAERVYAAVGFRDLGRFMEYVPPDRGWTTPPSRSLHDLPAI